jgi:hypothetical protein
MMLSSLPDMYFLLILYSRYPSDYHFSHGACLSIDGGAILNLDITRTMTYFCVYSFISFIVAQTLDNF